MNRKGAETFFKSARGVRAVVLGDLMLDEYLWGKAERISPEAPVQVVDVQRTDLRLGGAGNVANNLLALGCRVDVCSVIGDDDDGALLTESLRRQGVGVEGLVIQAGRATTRKTRVMAANQQIVRLDRETRSPITSDCEERLVSYLDGLGNDCRVLLVSDYLKGVLTSRVLQAAREAGQRLAVPVVVDPKGDDYGKYRGVTIITPNRREAEQASRIPIRDEEGLCRAGESLLKDLELTALLITRSEAGMSLFRPGAEPFHIPTEAREVYDVAGAGDTVLAALGLGLACGLPPDEAARLANLAAGIAVGKVGTSTVTPAEVVAAVGRGHADSDAKIKDREVLAEIIAGEKGRGKRIVFTNGCFDLLHAGHVKYLQKARQFGDLLVLGLNSDASVRRLKGDKRPLIAEEERAHLLAALDCVDYLVIFDEDTPLELIALLTPHVLVKGGDYTVETVVGHEIVEAAGGRVELVEFVDGRSTTGLIERILSAYA